MILPHAHFSHPIEQVEGNEKGSEATLATLREERDKALTGKAAVEERLSRLEIAAAQRDAACASLASSLEKAVAQNSNLVCCVGGGVAVSYGLRMTWLS